MKIAFLHMTMGLIERGSEVVVDSLAQALSKKHEVLVLQSDKVSQKPHKVVRIDVLTVAPPAAPTNFVDKIAFRLHVDRESGLVASFTGATEDQLSSFDPDIVVAINGPLQLKILKRMRLTAKLVAFGHAGIGYHDRDTLREGPDLFVALSDRAQIWAKTIAPERTKVTCIKNPFDPTPYQKAKPLKLGMTPPVVMVASSLSPHKNIGNVVKAVSQLGYSLLLIGDGENHSEIESVLSQYPGEFRWIKSLDHQEMAPYYRSANTFCFVPDSQEAFGMVYLEAMASGLPIVATDDDIRHSIIGKQGLYVDPSNQLALREAIKQAVSLDRLSYASELKPYYLPAIVDQLEEVFYDITR